MHFSSLMWFHLKHDKTENRALCLYLQAIRLANDLLKIWGYFMNNIKILDCTLRDGAHINQGVFGKNNILYILTNLAQAKIDLIEIGFLQNTSYDKDSSIFNDIQHIDDILSQIQKNQNKFGLMLRTDGYDFNKLQKSNFVDFVRVSFYKEHLRDLKNYVSKLQDLNYDVYLNPIAITKYSLDEIMTILEFLLPLKPKRNLPCRYFWSFAK